MDREFHEQDRRGKRRKAPKPLQHKQENPVVELTPAPFQVGDLLNFLSAIFFGIHMLRTEHISRSTKKESFLAILGYEVCVVALLSRVWVFIGGRLDGARYSNQSSWLWTWTELWDWIVAFPWIPALYTGAFFNWVMLMD
ncbi:uncharacterized protein LOC110745472 isoform X2 [Prunus avium]|uniref:Uncharacterized protein LOC110745472 isoform X2 n=1 Tax=Prunus avium TaxID=42229 RepID=A0A6P5R8S1_PRUAV|nr:uncharacterized protein LOC110745472 isoform X2 [Prunus avium]